HESFSGLPSPAAAGTVASFMIAYPELQELARLPENPGWWDQITHSAAVYLEPGVKVLVPIVRLLCACLMVSRVKYAHVFNQWFRGRRSYQHILQLVIGMAAIFIVREMAVPLIFCVFAFGPPLRAGWKTISRRKPAEPGGPSLPSVTPHDP